MADLYRRRFLMHRLPILFLMIVLAFMEKYCSLKTNESRSFHYFYSFTTMTEYQICQPYRSLIRKKHAQIRQSGLLLIRPIVSVIIPSFQSFRKTLVKQDPALPHVFPLPTSNSLRSFKMVQPARTKNDEINVLS